MIFPENNVRQTKKNQTTVRVMESKGEPSTQSSFTTAMTLTNLGVSHVPQSYVLPPSERPNLNDNLHTNVPVIDLSLLLQPSLKPSVVAQIRKACREFGFFQVINHGVPSSLIKGALDAATGFFNLPLEEKIRHMSNNVNEPVRYGTSVNFAVDKIHYWRDFIKHYAHPISKWIHLWPANPPSYKEKMGNYAMAVQALQKKLMEVVVESLGLDPNHLQDGSEEGSQVIAVNCYPSCPEPQLVLGIPPHSDYGSLTILIQSSLGLQVMDCNKNWFSVPMIDGALNIQLGDQMEVFSNGQYKSVVHRATVSSDRKRLSIASLHSLEINKKMGPAPGLVDEQNPALYKQFSFQDFLDFISSNDISRGRFIDTLKKHRSI